MAFVREQPLHLLQAEFVSTYVRTLALYRDRVLKIFDEKFPADLVAEHRTKLDSELELARMGVFANVDFSSPLLARARARGDAYCLCRTCEENPNPDCTAMTIRLWDSAKGWVEGNVMLMSCALNQRNGGRENA